jgi:hypothetical protein
MPQKLPISTQRRVLKLEQQVFNLKQKLARTKAKYEKQIAELKAKPQPVITEKERLKLIERRDAALEANARLQ